MYTKGPWERYVYDQGGSRIYVRQDGESRILIADTYQLGDRDLLFAAPDLLKALKDLMEAIPDPETISYGVEIAYTKGLSAIAKAEGK